MHFEARKHLLEYDDVANEQRKAIYRVRNELLDPEYNIAHKIIENRQDSIKMLLEKCEVFNDDDNLEMLCAQAKEDFNIQLNQAQLKESFKIQQNFENYIEEVLINNYELKMQNLDAKTRSDVEKLVYLQTLDNLWREHLYVMDNLKTGIGLRGYNQKDPLVEYKKESYNLFVELVAQIKYTTIKMLQRVQFKAINTTESVKTLHQKPFDSTRIKKATQLKTPIFKGRPVRNEPCPCGSGKKYKDCCGKSGPKSGELARKA